MPNNKRFYRGFLQSDDGVVTGVIRSDPGAIAFKAAFGLSDHLAERLKHQPDHLLFSERSRIARLGIRLKCERPRPEALTGNTVELRLTASAVIPGYPGLDAFRDFFTTGFPVGRLVFCDPDALLTSEQVMAAIERAELKLPASTTISSDGSILIAPHKVICDFKNPMDPETLSRILFKEEGREILNRFQIRRRVDAVTIPAGQGVITTCSMYLNDHYVVLESGTGAADLGAHLPALILDPIKTRGIRIYLEIVNESDHPIVNPLISARVYRAPRRRTNGAAVAVYQPRAARFSYNELRGFEGRLDALAPSTCHFLNKPVAVAEHRPDGLSAAKRFGNGPEKDCPVTKAACHAARQDYSTRGACPHRYATAHIKDALEGKPAALILKYFPNILEHLDIVNLASEGALEALYFYNPSCEHGPFLSQLDHHRLQEYNAFGVAVYWASSLKDGLMVHTMRDGKGYFVDPDRIADFHKSMLFAFYGSTMPLSGAGVGRLGRLMDALIDFWGKNIGIVTGGGSGVMEHANTFARKRGILSGANYLDITDQPMTTDVDFCQVFQDSCRHSRQKWFEIASFPIFNLGGLGSLEELGITLCNMKLSIMEPVPVILFDSEGNGDFWRGTENQILEMVRQGRAPSWGRKNMVITDDPEDVIRAYRERLQLF